MSLNTVQKFFYKHAGSSYQPAVETLRQGKERGARKLARAERYASDHGCTFQWSIDPYVNSSEFSDERPAWALWICTMRNSFGDVVESLSGIDFGSDGEPWDQPYRRVVEAELALEYIAQ